MTQLSIKPSKKKFKSSGPRDWPRWKKHFQQFWDASGLSANSQKCQINILLYCLDEDADNVLVHVSTNIRT